ncbi:putative heat shock protein 70 family [Sesbania bispinosa]|nr:putative heat shock protein 70 family [Sesbania bispinosa]
MVAMGSNKAMRESEQALSQWSRNRKVNPSSPVNKVFTGSEGIGIWSHESKRKRDLRLWPFEPQQQTKIQMDE